MNRSLPKWVILSVILVLAAGFFLADYLLAANAFIGETSGWEIASATVDADILWQKTVLSSGPIAANDGGVALDVAFRGMIATGPRLVALDAATGNLQWTLPELPVRRLTSFNEGYLATLGEVEIARIDSNGRIRWKTANLSARTYTPPFIANGNVYLATESAVYVFSFETGTLLEQQVPESRAGIAFFDDLAVYRSGDRFLAFDADGSPHTPSLTGSLSPAAHYIGRADNILIVGDATRLTAFDLATGAIAWTLATTPDAVSAVIGEWLVTYETSGTLHVRDIRSGDLLGTITLANPAVAALTTLPNLIAGHADHVYLYDGATTTLLALRLHI